MIHVFHLIVKGHEGTTNKNSAHCDCASQAFSFLECHIEEQLLQSRLGTSKELPNSSEPMNEMN